MAVKYTRPRGTQDVLPGQSGRWLRLEKLMRRTVGLYGYKEIRLPTFEATEVFARGVGDTTDIVSKEMYTFLDKGNRSITLRPEGTSGVARAILENGLLGSSPAPLKAYYLQSCFRYEKAQKGRLREFHQLGIECYGADDPAADAEVIAVARQILSAAGLRQVRLEINSIGCPHCRPRYHEALREYFSAHKAELCETCLERLDRNPMRILDCKSPVCSAIAEGAPKVLDYLCEDCADHFEQVKALLTQAGISYVVNPTIVRGLDYYTRTVFECVFTDKEGNRLVCGGGGRYGGLLGELGGPDYEGIGFAMGLERLLKVMIDQGCDFPPEETCDVYIASMGDKAGLKAFQLVNLLRSDGFQAQSDLMGRSIKAQMKYANKIGAKYTIVLGDNELEQGEATLKSMYSGSTRTVPLDDRFSDAIYEEIMSTAYADLEDAMEHLEEKK